MKSKLYHSLLVLSFIFLPLLHTVAQQGCFSNTISGPTRTEIQLANPVLVFTVEPSVNPCNTAAGTALTGIGINQTNPLFMFDVLCDPTNSTLTDINVSCPNCMSIVNCGMRLRLRCR